MKESITAEDKLYNKKLFFMLYIVKMIKKQILTFGKIEIEKRKFYYSKYPININNVNIKKIIISKKKSSSKKRFLIIYWLKR